MDTKTAVVGDPLNMIFEILDTDSPYEIFVRDLVAVDGATDIELVLIDDRGCPVEPSIMSELRKSEQSEKMLESSFDAFRFPSSQMVQFRAMVSTNSQNTRPDLSHTLHRTLLKKPWGKSPMLVNCTRANLAV